MENANAFAYLVNQPHSHDAVVAGFFSHGGYAAISTEVAGNNAYVLSSGILRMRTGHETSVEDFKAFAVEQNGNGTPLTVVYPLQTPVETPLTDEELEACKALHANNPNTTVLNDAGAEMLVGCIDSANESAFQMALRSASAEEDIEAHNADTTAHPDIRELVDEAVSAVSDAKATEKSLTIPASGWTGSAAPYTNTISVTGVKAEGTNQDIYPASTIDADTLNAWQAANMIGAGQGEGTITLKAFGTKPPVNLPARIKITPVKEV